MDKGQKRRYIASRLKELPDELLENNEDFVNFCSEGHWIWTLDVVRFCAKEMGIPFDLDRFQAVLVEIYENDSLDVSNINLDFIRQILLITYL